MRLWRACNKKVKMSSAVRLCILSFFTLLLYNIVTGAYQSAGCSDEGCGIPCYLRPAEDSCHYTDHGHSPCDDGGGDDLVMQLRALNSTMIRLQKKLIQKGIISAGDNCPALPNIEHGGVIYTDLLISTGVIATYVCEEGYSLHGHGKYECAVDGVWLGNTTEQMPTCEDSLVVCSLLVPIPNGHLSYTIKDSTLIKPGDLVVYSCEPPFVLKGETYRVCLNNGTWTNQEPKCTASKEEPTSKPASSTANAAPLAIGTVFGVLVGVLFLISIVVGVIVYAKKRRREGGYNGLKGNDTDKTVEAKEQRGDERQTLVETLQSQQEM